MSSTTRIPKAEITGLYGYALKRFSRKLLGDGITMMVDFGYRWTDWRSALWVLARLEDCNIFRVAQGYVA